MRLTTLTDYALRLLMSLAQRPERLCTIAEIADSYGVLEAYMMKSTHQLGLAGCIHTVRGRGGSMRLEHAPQYIGLGAVVRSTEPDFFIVECFSTGSICMLPGVCKLARVIDGALRSIMSYLDGNTLVDILPASDDFANAHVMRRFQPAQKPAV